jgi:hypothetical protein
MVLSQTQELMAVGMVAQYHYSDNVIYGFSHTHLNEQEFDFGDIMIMPTMGAVSFDNKTIHPSLR